jgi:hypothetical protein
MSRHVFQTRCSPGELSRMAFPITVLSSCAHSLCRRPLGRVVSEYGTLCHGDGATDGATAPPEGANVGYSPTRCAAVSAMRRVLHEGHTARHLREYAMSVVNISTLRRRSPPSWPPAP